MLDETSKEIFKQRLFNRQAGEQGRYDEDKIIMFVKFDDILSHIDLDSLGTKKNKNVRLNINGRDIKVLGNSLRLPSFYKIHAENKAKNQPMKCACCGRLAPDFLTLIQGKLGNGTLELLSYDYDKPLLFTHDHVKNRKSGGEDSLSNLQTLCVECNYIKSELYENRSMQNNFSHNSEYSLEGLQEIMFELLEGKL